MQKINLLSEDGDEVQIYNPYLLEFEISHYIYGKKYTFSKAGEAHHLFEKGDFYFNRMRYFDRLKVAQAKVMEEFNNAMRDGVLTPPKTKAEDDRIKRKMYSEAAKLADKLKDTVVVYRY